MFYFFSFFLLFCRSSARGPLLEFCDYKLIVNFDFFSGLLRLQNAFFDQDIEEGHLGANFVSQCSSLVIVRQHLDIGNRVIKPHAITLIPRSVLAVSKVNVQVVESRLVMEVAHDLASVYVELRLDSIQTFISNGFEEG